jgi:AcrB/AcrD/AcrF family
MPRDYERMSTPYKFSGPDYDVTWINSLLSIGREYPSRPHRAARHRVLNGVVLVSYFNQLRAHGVPEGRIVLEGTKRRLRPVLMTASITALGLMPLLFASGPGSEIQRPLAC